MRDGMKIRNQWIGSLDVKMPESSSKDYIHNFRGDRIVVVKEWDEIFEEDRLYHLNFEGKYYWICLGKFREYFKKI